MTPEHLEEVQVLCPAAKPMAEGGVEFLFLPSLALPCSDVVDALLCPTAHSGYTTRLFLSKQIPGRGQNWNTFTILGRTWWSPSFNNVQATLRPLQILDAHLQLYR
jgi:hypothetical protein